MSKQILNIGLFLLEPVFNAPEQRNSKFDLLHGVGTFSDPIGAMIWKPTVYADMSIFTCEKSPDQLANVLHDWLSQYPEKVIFDN